MDQGQMEQMKEMKKLLATPEGQKLLKLLSRDGGSALKRAGSALRQGDTDGVQKAMGPMVEDPEVQKLLSALGENLGRG